MTISITPAQYTTLSLKLENTPGVTVHPLGPNGGTITTSDVTLSYAYDPNKGNADVVVTAKHSFLARHASDDTIDQHITAEFNKWMQPA